ncbi:anaphase-promoting complex subunit 16 [Nematostella vectensis]|uniref:anaphase-promoting complex subunit 16 n=1 Tax=Nematostella vectensis TaxID=45351 RepID=UPI001390566E|nr:anaphase-promoting complex subunit 16 [Nematostella vectensis]
MAAAKKKVAAGDGLRKALFQSPMTEEENATDKTTEALLNKLQVEIEVDNNLTSLDKEMHEQRLSKLRKELDHNSQDEWKYKPIEQIIRF